jgi:hypothetical protein
MTFYLLYYLTIGAILTVGYLLKNKLFTYIVVFIVVLFSGLRYNVGYDYDNYEAIFLGYNENATEPLFSITIFLLKKLWNDPIIMFFFFSLLTITITFFAIHRLSDSERLGFMIYLLIPGLYLNSFSIVRQAVAISFFFLGIFYLYKNKKIKYWGIGIIATLLHFSAVIPFLFLWIFKKWFTKKHNIFFHFVILLVAFIIAYLKLPKLFIGLFGKFSVYAELLTIEIPITKVLLYFFFGVIVVYFLRNRNDEKTNLLLNILQIGIFINIAFAEFPPVTRMGYYFLITQTILVPTVIFSFKHNSLKVGILILFMTYYYGIQMNALKTDEELPYKIKMTPYKSYLEK